MASSQFNSLNLSTELLDAVASLDYAQMTPIQEQSLPTILAGGDLIGQGKTGSGKTAAFGLGLLQKLKVEKYRIQSLVLCPTRELADQVAKEIRRLARTMHNVKVLTLCGGTPLGPQIGSLEHGAHIIVGTPGRIEDHLRKQTLKLNHVDTLVLDEADRMLEMGFADSLDAIISTLTAERQTLLFSATFPRSIQSIAGKYLREPKLVKVESTHDSATITQHFFELADNSELATGIRLLLLHHRPQSTLIFCNTKAQVKSLCDELREAGFTALALHGDMEQRERHLTLVQFANNSASILVATDVAARGLDVDALEAVVNCQPAHDVEVHVHRIGRTGRAGSNGKAFTFYQAKERFKIDKLEHFLEQDFKAEVLPPTEILKQPAFTPAMATLEIDGGKKQKLRAGDILGALTRKEGKDEIAGHEVGKIDLFDTRAFVAVKRDKAQIALRKISNGKMKGRKFRIRRADRTTAL